MKQSTFLDALWTRVAHIPRQVVRSKFKWIVRAGHGEDCEQEAMLAVWRDLPKLQGARGSPEQLAWVSAYGAARDFARRLNRKSKLEAAISTLPLQSDAQRGIWPEYLLRTMHPASRVPVVRSVLLGQTLSEIYLSMNRKQTPRTLQFRIRRGIEQMRAAVESDAA